MPALRFASLGSGSSGNSTLVELGDTRVLLDCGFTLKETLRRLECLQISPESLSAMLISHEHSDHIRGAGPLARKFQLPVYMTHGTFSALKDQKLPHVQLLHAHEAFTLGDLTVDPFPTPHDAAESCQFVFGAGGRRFAVITDAGFYTPHICAKLDGVDAVLIESNYDDELLRNGPYPASLQARIRGNFGHLGNVQAAELARMVDHPGLQYILLGHLSERNNTPAHARETVCALLEQHRHERVNVLSQHECSVWFELPVAPVSGEPALVLEDSADIPSERLAEQLEPAQTLDIAAGTRRPAVDDNAPSGVTAGDRAVDAVVNDSTDAALSAPLLVS